MDCSGVLEMKIFHSHFFEHPPTMYKEAYQKIIVEHHIKYELILYCKCGEMKKVVVSLKFDVDEGKGL